MEAFDVLGDPVRRRILELLASGERPAGDVAATIQAEFGLTQPAVSRHLRVLRESGFATVKPVGTRRLYALDADGFEGAEEWLASLRAQWNRRLDALATEIARGRRGSRPADPSRGRTEDPSRGRPEDPSRGRPEDPSRGRSAEANREENRNG
jgi:DNA-binding transcriptional ArsR family regulator